MSTSAYSEVYYGIGYGNMSEDVETEELSLGVLDLTIGNRFNEKFSLELTVASGIQDDEVVGEYSIDGGQVNRINLKSKTSFYARALYHFDENFFINAIWGRMEAEMCYQAKYSSVNLAAMIDTVITGTVTGSYYLHSYEDHCVSAGDTEGGLGLGMDFPLKNDSAIRLSYDYIDGTNLLSLKYVF